MAGEICPYLGVKDDPQTAVAFPSARNCCFRTGNPGRIEIQRQADSCLGGDYAACPIYQGLAVPAPLINESAEPVRAAPRQPKRDQPASQKQPIPAARPRQLRRRDGLILLLVGIFLIGLWVGVLAFLPDSTLAFGLPSVSTPTSFATSTAVEPTVFLPIIERQQTFTITVTTRPTITFTPTRTKKPTRTATQTLLFTATSTLFVAPTESCGAPAGWVQYVIRAGDTLSSLSRIFNISIQQLQSANCMGTETTLYVGRLMYVPFYPPVTVAPTLPAPSATLTKAPTKAPTMAPSNTAPPPPSDTPVPPTQPPTETPVPQPTETLPSPPPEPSPET